MQPDTIIKGIRYEIGRSGYKSPPENFHADEDYPYGRTLRCRRAHWLETASSGAKIGETRHVTCTTNPKTGNRTWNAPKPGGYSDVCILYVKGDHWGAEAGWVGVDSIHLNSEPCEVDAFEARWTGQLGDFERDRIKLIRAWHLRMSKVRWSIGGAPVAPTPEPTDEELAGVIPDAATLASRVSTLPATHADGYRAALARAGRMAWVSGLRCLVIAVNHGRGEFHVYPDGPNARRKIVEYPASYRVVGIVDPPAPEPDPAPRHDSNADFENDSFGLEDESDPAPDGFALDWESIVPELDASIPWERDGRTVKTLQLCTDLDCPDISVVKRDRDIALSKGLDIIAEPVGLFLLRDLGPIPPDVELEDMPTDRADDDGMANHPPAPFRAINRPWLEPLPPAPPALMPPRGKLMAPLDVLMMLDQLE